MSSADPYRYFRIEARELLEQLGQGVLALEKDGALDQIVVLLRLAHTLKGAARVVKQPQIADGAHGLEELLTPFRGGEQAVPRAVLDAVLGLVDQMTARLGALGRPAPVATPTPDARPPVLPIAPDVRTVRADLEEMDVLLEGLTEAHVQLAGLKRTLGSLAQAGELADLLAEQVAPLRTGGSPAATKARSLAEELRATLQRLERSLGFETTQIDRELRAARESAERLRLVPARVLSTPLERAVRDAAHAQDKDVVFSIRGDDVRLDAHVIEGVQAGLVQIARNAVAHGIEPAGQRRAAGKALVGRIGFSVERRGRRIAFVFQDDGQGIDVAAIQRVAAARGWPRPASLDEAIELLLGGGVSTAGTVTEIAGRGIGLGLARAAAAQLGGELSIRSEPGKGVTVELVVPVPLAAIPALVVEADGVAASVPLEAVRRGVRLAAADLSRGPTGETLIHDGKVIPFVALARVVSGAVPERGRAWSAVVVECASGTAALGVDRLIGTTHVVVRPLPELAPAAPIVGGASFDPEGNPQLVLDPDGIVAAAQAVWHDPTAPASRRRILVVDDSLTTRMLEQSILESAGYEVELASSGEEGLEKARKGGHALYLVDVEMPGIDGFTFVEWINADPELRRIPAILVTSLSDSESLRRGKEVGAKDYVVKGDFDQGRLLARIRELVSVIRVLVADDSLTVRRHLVEVLSNAPGFTVVGEATNGKEAIALCQLHRPDAVTLDMAMPVMSGLAATEYIMAHCPTPILIVSSSVNRGELFKTYEALAAGALDVLEKPRGDEGEGVWEQNFLATVRLVSRIRVITHIRRRLDLAPPPLEAPVVVLPGGPITLLAIGASTGGPAALVEVLRAFPADLEVVILVVLHIGLPFAAGFAEWLDGQVRRRVRCARHGERLADLRDSIIMAVPERHLSIQGGRLRLGEEPPRHSCRPSVDVLFESVAREIGPGAAACLLTGMGRDGADGLLKIRKAGGRTFAQDEATSVVYGMPREAAILGAAERVLGLSSIGPAMVQLVEAHK